VLIALVHYSTLPIVGGVETIVGEHTRLLREAGHEVTVVCGAGSGDHLLKELADRASTGAQVRGALRPVFEKQQVVILHNVLTMPFHPGLTEALWQLADELPAVRFFAWIHDLAACNPDYSRPKLSTLLATAHPRIEYVAISEHRREQFETLTGRTAQVIPNGLDPLRLLDLPEPLCAFCREHRVIERELILLHPTRLLRRKNIELSLRVLAALRAAGRDALLLVTGARDPHQAESDEYATSLHTLRETLGAERDALFLHDFFTVTPRDLIRLLGVADALFFPSHQEGFGLPILEAALHRLPIFCADLAPMNFLVEHRLSTFDPAAPPAEIAAEIARHLHLNPATQARKEIVRRYSWDTIFRQHLAPLLRT
jgi:glycosyltransferase involved in cell wall biosynthesis